MSAHLKCQHIFFWIISCDLKSWFFESFLVFHFLSVCFQGGYCLWGFLNQLNSPRAENMWKSQVACLFLQGLSLLSEIQTLLLNLLKLSFFLHTQAYVFTPVHRLGGRCHFYFNRTEWHVGVWCGGLCVTLAFLIYKIRVEFLHFSLDR